jgi:hypothetical protein
VSGCIKGINQGLVASIIPCVIRNYHRPSSFLEALIRLPLHQRVLPAMQGKYCYQQIRTFFHVGSPFFEHKIYFSLAWFIYLAILKGRNLLEKQDMNLKSRIILFCGD